MAEDAATAKLSIDSKIDRCIDRTLRRVMYGGLAGAAAAVLLLRSPAARTSVISLGVGFGAGSAYRDCEAEVRGGTRAPSVTHPTVGQGVTLL